MPSELIKYLDNRALLRPRQEWVGRGEGVGILTRLSGSNVKVRREFRCNSLILEGLLLDSFQPFLLASSLAPGRELSNFTTSQG